MTHNNNPVVFVGAGPGDPELITVAGKRAVSEADLIVWAGSLVGPEVLSWRKEGSEVVDSAGLNLDRIIEYLTDGHQAGKKVVRLHTGDPSLYGALHEQLVRLKAASVPYRIIPGVTAAFAAAASLGLEYTLPLQTQTLILTRAAGRTPVPEAEELAGLAAHGSSLAIYLSAGQGPKVSTALSRAFGQDAPVAVVYRASWPDERIEWTTAGTLTEDLAAAGINKHALIIAGPSVATLATGREAAESKLYDAGFSHGCRRGDAEK